MMHFRLIGFVLLIALIVPFTTFGVEEGEKVEGKAEAEEGVDLHAIPPILDTKYRHQKKNQFEFTLYGGSYLGNTLGQTWIAGIKAYYFFNNNFAVGTTYGYSRLLTDRGSPFGSIMTDNNMHIAVGSFILSNDVALRAYDSLIQMDFYLTFGAGGMWINSAWEPVGQLGGGVKIYPGITWLAFRIDLDGYMHFTEQPGSNPFDCDVVLVGGVSFLFPPYPSAYEK